MVQLYHKKTINIDRKTPNIKTKKGVESSDFHTFSYGYLLLFIVTYLTSSKVTYTVNQLVMRILVQIWAFYNDAF